MQDIVKVINLNCNGISDIFIFRGNDIRSDYYTTNDVKYNENKEEVNSYLGAKMIEDIGRSGNNGLTQLESGDVKIHYVNDRIHYDDTIETAKTKLSKCFDGE